MEWAQFPRREQAEYCGAAPEDQPVWSRAVGTDVRKHKLGSRLGWRAWQARYTDLAGSSSGNERRASGRRSLRLLSLDVVSRMAA